MDQNDIDSLLNGDPDPDEQNNADAGGDFDLGELSQADIDAALAGATPQPAKAADAGDGMVSDDAGFNQADIDALMDGAGGANEPVEAATASDDVVLDSTGKPMDEFAAAMAAAIEEEQATAAASPSPGTNLPVADVELPDFDQRELLSEAAQPISLLHDVELHVKIELGRTHMFVEDVLRLTEGSVVELDRLAGDPVDVYVNGRLVARGEVLVLNDNFCVRVSEIIVDPSARLAG